MAVTTDLFKDVLFNDGEGVEHEDLNELRAFLLARIADQHYEHLCGALAQNKDPDLFGENDNDVGLQSLIYTMTGGEAILWADGSPTDELRVTAGTVFQKVAASDGATPTFLPHTIRLADHAFTISPGDATNPRIDIVQVKLELVNGDAESRDFEDGTTRIKSSTTPSKTRRVRCTMSVKEGTPGATPTYPTPDAGYALLGAVRVPATWTGGFVADGTGSSSAGLRQCSIPLRIEAVHQSPVEGMQASSVSNWGVIDAGPMQATGGAGSDLIVWAPKAAHGKRIVGVGIVAKWVTSGQVLLQRVPWTASGYSLLGAPSVDLSATLVNTDGTLRFYFAHLGVIAEASSDSNPTAANGPIGDPFWASGGKGGPTHRPVQGGVPSTTMLGNRAALIIDGGQNTHIDEVVWYLAG